MDTTIQDQAHKQPKTLAELMPGLTGIISKESAQLLTARKQTQNRATMSVSATAERKKPLTIADMMGSLRALRTTAKSPSRNVQQATSAMKRRWNSSIKVQEKKFSHTSYGQVKHSAVRKVLNFQPPAAIQPRFQVPTTSRPLKPANSDTPKFPKPEFRAKKALASRGRPTTRISGISNIPETPIEARRLEKRFTMNNKENLPITTVKSSVNSIKSKSNPNPRLSSTKKTILHVPDTPLSNTSWKSSCDASFLLKEKEIHESEANILAICEQSTIEKISAITPPASTPFREYRHVHELLNDTNDADKSVCVNDTIMCFDNPSIVIKENDCIKKDDSVIASLCQLLDKATVTSTEKPKTELEILMEIKSETENNIKSQLKLLKYVDKLIQKKLKDSESPERVVNYQRISIAVSGSPIMLGSADKNNPKSPIYKIPKKNSHLRKSLGHKSMPNIASDSAITKLDSSDRALSMYMQMKEQMDFLNTPRVKRRPAELPDTPALTSHNLQHQLDKLFNGS